MSGEPIVTLCGSAGGDAELKFLGSGVAVASWSLAVTPRIKKGDEWADDETVWYRCQAWRQLGEQASESIVKGMRLLVHGRLKVRTYQKDGQTRTALEVDVEHVGAEMRHSVVTAVKAQRSSSGGGFSPPAGGTAGAGVDPWASSPDSEQAPF